MWGFLSSGISCRYPKWHHIWSHRFTFSKAHHFWYPFNKFRACFGSNFTTLKSSHWRYDICWICVAQQCEVFEQKIATRKIANDTYNINGMGFQQKKTFMKPTHDLSQPIGKLPYPVTPTKNTEKPWGWSALCCSESLFLASILAQMTKRWLVQWQLPRLYL